MKFTLKTALWFLVDLAATVAVAWAGKNWIQGFDIRGPFLVMSPLYAIAICGLIFGRSFLAQKEMNGSPKPSDNELIQSTAMEFGFGSVTVVQQRWGSDLKLVITPEGGKQISLPKNWQDLSKDARRFAVVLALAPTKLSFASRLIHRIPFDTARAVAMLAAGMNLWLILACHAIGAVWLGLVGTYGRKRSLIKNDEKALRKMRDLKAAIAFVGHDPMNDAMQVSATRRIEALQRTAVRMGLA